MGVVTGTVAGRNTIINEGNEERISGAIRKVSIELAALRTPSGRKRAEGSGTPMVDTADSTDQSVPDEKFYGMETVDDQSSDDGSSRGMQSLSCSTTPC